MLTLLALAGSTFLALMLGTGVLHGLPRLGAAGRSASDWLCGGLGLDLAVAYFTALPLVVGPALGGWAGLAGAVVGMYAALVGWTVIHELAHPDDRRRPRLYQSLNRAVGTGWNLAAVFYTSLASPVFNLVRLAEWVVYPPVAWMVGMPTYNSREWVNVSRQKFPHLVGHDRVWCLYCDWMTGLWSLGSEMLRNIESFWCPIRFLGEHGAAKCENCKIDFPDVRHAWVSEHGDAADAARLLAEKYEGTAPGERAWFGHPVRVTVGGKPPAGGRTGGGSGGGGSGESAGAGEAAAEREEEMVGA